MRFNGWLRFAAAVVLLPVLGWASSCTSRVHPPKSVADGVSIYLVDAALHSGVVVPDGPNRWVEFGFGEYRWYAQGKNQWYRTIPAILWSTPGTLGRREFYATDAETIRVRSLASRVDEIEVERAKVDALRAQLEEQFATGTNPISHNSPRMSFVERGGYWFGRNCHDATADWCRALGCDVGSALIRNGVTLASESD